MSKITSFLQVWHIFLRFLLRVAPFLAFLRLLWRHKYFYEHQNIDFFHKKYYFDSFQPGKTHVFLQYTEKSFTYEDFFGRVGGGVVGGRMEGKKKYSFKLSQNIQILRFYSLKLFGTLFFNFQNPGRLSDHTSHPSTYPPPPHTHAPPPIKNLHNYENFRLLGYKFWSLLPAENLIFGEILAIFESQNAILPWKIAKTSCTVT